MKARRMVSCTLVVGGLCAAGWVGLKGGGGGLPEALRRSKVEKQVREESSGPIVFYGRVEDQDDRPVPGALVHWTVTDWGASFPGRLLNGGTKTGEATTDRDGGFEIRSKGTLLTIERIEKAGFQPIGRYATFGYHGFDEDYVPDPGAPESFRILKEGVKEVFSEARVNRRLKWDGQPERIELRTGKQSPQGELIITAIREGGDGQSKARAFDWSFTLEVQDGGIVEVRDPDGGETYAPGGGYEKKWAAGSKAADDPWTGNVRTTLFFHHQSGYGRIELNLFGDRGKHRGADYYMDVFLNESGGRNTKP